VSNPKSFSVNFVQRQLSCLVDYTEKRKQLIPSVRYEKQRIRNLEKAP